MNVRQTQQLQWSRMVDEMRSKNANLIVSNFRTLIAVCEAFDIADIAHRYFEEMELETYSPEGRAILHYQIRGQLEVMKRSLEHFGRVQASLFPELDWEEKLNMQLFGQSTPPEGEIPAS